MPTFFNRQIIWTTNIQKNIKSHWHQTSKLFLDIYKIAIQTSKNIHSHKEHMEAFLQCNTSRDTKPIFKNSKKVGITLCILSDHKAMKLKIHSKTNKQTKQNT